MDVPHNYGNLYPFHSFNTGGDSLQNTNHSLKQVILSGIRRTLIKMGTATKVELSKKLDISFPTISKFLAQMEQEGEIVLVGLDDSSGGRRAKRYSYNTEYMLGLAIYLEKDGTYYTLYNCKGEVHKEEKWESVLKEDGISLLTNLISSLLNDNSRIKSISIGVPGSVDHGRIFFIPGYEAFKNFHLKEYYEKLFSMPVKVENDMNAAVLGYYYRNGIKKNQSLVYMYSGQNGPGAGFMINGDVVRGSSFFAGEISFIPISDTENFGQALLNQRDRDLRTSANEGRTIDTMSRLIASFVAIINPHTIIFCSDEVNETLLLKIKNNSSKYIPSEHLPNLLISDWKRDYLYGLQSLGIELLMYEV